MAITSRIVAIYTNVSKLGRIEFVHHLEIV